MAVKMVIPATSQLWRDYVEQHNQIVKDYTDGKMTLSDCEAFLDDLYFEYKKAKGLVGNTGSILKKAGWGGLL